VSGRLARYAKNMKGRLGRKVSGSVRHVIGMRFSSSGTITRNASLALKRWARRYNAVAMSIG
jgi:hypothetical protein